MPYTSQKPASASKVLALALRETVFVLGWALLGGAVLLPFTAYWYAGIIPGAILSAYALARMEAFGRTGPLVALEMRQYSAGGRRRVPLWRTFTRILVTVVTAPPLAAGYLPMAFGTRPLPELASRTRLTSLDRRLDPRPKMEIEASVKAARQRFRLLAAAPLVASAAMFVLNARAPEVIMVQGGGNGHELPEHERELLIQYLELTSLHPEELEYHVRLASLYYRNGMERDLAEELQLIAGIDPEHAILILADTTAFHFGMITPEEPDTLPPDLTVPELTPVTPAEQDSLQSDTLETDSMEVPEDTLDASQEDTPTLPDTSAFAGEPLEETPPETLETGTVQLENDTVEQEEPALEPDTLVPAEG